MPQFRKWFNRAIGKNNYANVSINGGIDGVTLSGNTPLTVSPTEITKARVPNAHWFRFACLFLCLFATGICVLSYADIRGYGLPPSLDINDQCKDRCTSDASSMCNLPKEVQFKKFIWFITDGYPYSLASNALELYKNHSVPYLVEVYGTKWSHTIYTSWFTGLTAMNLLGDPIVGDNLFAAIRRAKDCNGSHIFDIKYYGPEWAPLVLIGGAEYAEKEYGIKSELVLEKLKELVAYPSITPERLPQVLEEAYANQQSLILHSGQFDKATHLLPEESYNTIGVHLDKFFSLPAIKSFVDAHPEYLLILSSDHGMTLGKKIFHGQEHARVDGAPNNIGFLNFYNPVFDGRAWSEIQVVDVLPTLAKYLEGVDIPFHSIGQAHNYYPPQYQQAYLKAAKQNLHQLQDAAIFRNLPFDQDKLIQALRSDDLTAVQAMAHEMKLLIYRPRLPTHALLLTFFSALIVAFYVLWTKVINKGDILRTSILALPLMFVFFFVWIKFKSVLLDTGAFSVILSSALIAVDVYFSPAKIPILLVNESLNWIDWALHLGINALPRYMGLWVSLFGTALSLVEGLVWGKAFVGPKTWIYLHIHVALFFMTQNVEAMYFMWSFHFICFTLYVAIFAVMIYYIVRRKWSHLATPFTVLFLLLRAGDISVVFLNFQFHQILPRLLVDKVNPSIFALQASTLYITNHFFWFFSYPMGERFNMDVNPLNGLVGVTNWNQYPSYSGFLMGFSKYGIFGLSMILVPTIIKNRIPLVTLSFQAVLTALVCHVVIAVYQAQYHAVESAVAMTGAFTVHLMGFVFCELLEPPKIDYINAKRY